MISADERVAIFAQDADGAWMLAHEGDAEGSYRVQSITPDRVIVLGPDQVLALHVEERADRPVRAEPVAAEPVAAGRTPAEQGASQLGLTAGLAAARYDSCVRQGLLVSNAAAGAFARLLAVVLAMARLPPVQDPNGNDATQPATLAEWIRIGAETALRSNTNVGDRAGCERAARAWTDVAGRLGAR